MPPRASEGVPPTDGDRCISLAPPPGLADAVRTGGRPPRLIAELLSRQSWAAEIRVDPLAPARRRRRGSDRGRDTRHAPTRRVRRHAPSRPIRFHATAFFPRVDGWGERHNWGRVASARDFAHRTVRLALGVTVLIVLSACASTPGRGSSPPTPHRPASTLQDPYPLAPGSSLRTAQGGTVALSTAPSRPPAPACTARWPVCPCRTGVAPPGRSTLG